MLGFLVGYILGGGNNNSYNGFIVKRIKANSRKRIKNLKRKRNLNYHR